LKATGPEMKTLLPRRVLGPRGTGRDQDEHGDPPSTNSDF
jgi:hypothetical protein